MKPRTIGRILAGWVVVWAVAGAQVAAGAQAADGSVELTYTNGWDAAITFSPILSMQGRFLKTTMSADATGVFRVAGQELAVAGRGRGKAREIGLDCDGDGRISAGEWKVIPPHYCVRFSGSAGGKEFTVDFFDAQVSVSPSTGKAFSMWALPVLRSGMTGRIDGVEVTIFDNSSADQFTVNYGNTILIGKSLVALPLNKIHRIGEHRYELKVARDGTRIDYRRLPEVPCGMVKTRFADGMVTGLILDGPAGAYDAAIDPVPAGTYQICYGVLGKNTPVFFRQTARGEPGLYEIQPDKLNILKIGPPIHVNMRLSYTGSMLYAGISEGNQMVSGCGGEDYMPFHLKDNSIPQPVGAIRIGSRIVTSGPMRPG